MPKKLIFDLNGCRPPALLAPVRQFFRAWGSEGAVMQPIAQWDNGGAVVDSTEENTCVSSCIPEGGVLPIAREGEMIIKPIMWFNMTRLPLQHFHS